MLRYFPLSFLHFFITPSIPPPPFTSPPSHFSLITFPLTSLLSPSALPSSTSEIDREDLAVQMRKRIGDYSRVVYLLRNGTGEEWKLRVHMCVCVYVCVRMCVRDRETHGLSH